MEAAPDARLYLVTPERFEPDAFTADLARLFDTVPVACIRLSLGAVAEEDDWRRMANHLMPVCHEADVPLVIAEHYRLVQPLGLDGVHLAQGGPPVRAVRKELGKDAILGAAAGASRHAGMTLAEAGADYVSLGPVGETGALGGGETAPDDLFAWWSEMIETPVVAEGGAGPEEARRLAETADFIVPDRRLWETPERLLPALREMAEILAG
ncbi:MAG: thiamine phosphate synthase [Pseudomonadota bacterium]